MSGKPRLIIGYRGKKAISYIMTGPDCKKLDLTDYVDICELEGKGEDEYLRLVLRNIWVTITNADES